MSDPCGWVPVVPTSENRAVLDSLANEDRELVEELAVRLLWNWTGRVYGACPVVYRPARTPLDPSALTRSPYGGLEGPRVSIGGGAWAWMPASAGSTQLGIGCVTCGTSFCACETETKALRLPWPTAAVTEILQDGAVLDPAAYRLDNSWVLRRLDGAGWPVSQDLSLPATEAGTWQVTFTYGKPLPGSGALAAGLLMLEIAKAIGGDSSCRLPQRVQTITRQGVTMTMVDAFEGLDKGQTGIWLVDSWVAAETKPVRTGGTVRSVDVPRSRYARG